jgi:hypothetical protein
LGNAETVDAPAVLPARFDTQATKALPQRTTEIQKLDSIRTIPNCIASNSVPDHCARQPASTRWVPANTQK